MAIITKRKGDNKQLQAYMIANPLVPSECFLLEDNNKFPAALLKQHHATLLHGGPDEGYKIHDEYLKTRHGYIKWYGDKLIFEDTVAHKPITEFPIRLDVYLFDTIIDDDFNQGQEWDLDNRFFPYAKSIPDLMKKLNKIPDDNILYITEPPHPIFVPVPDPEDRKLVVRIYKDTREIIKNNYFYKQKHGK